MFRGTLALALCASALIAAIGNAALPKPKPYQWTTAQASAAIMRQAEDFYVSDRGYVDLTSARCRGVGKGVQRRFVAFTCTATAPNGIAETLNLRVTAKTRKAGGLCWSVQPAPLVVSPEEYMVLPSGCFAPGKRGEGSTSDAYRAMAQASGTAGKHGPNSRCWPHGAGFFACSWTDVNGTHRATVTFTPAPVVKVLT